MGRFLGPSPMAGGDNGRRGRRYEALPAENEDDDGRSPREDNVADEQQSDAALPASSGRSNSRSALMRSDSEASEQVAEGGDDQGDEEKQQPQLHRQQADNTDEEAQAAKVNEVAKVATPESNEDVETKVTSAADGQQAVDAAADESETEDKPEELEAGMIQVRILDLNGKFFTIPCRLDWTVALMKKKVLESTEVPVTSQRLIYRGRVLEDDQCLSSYKVEDGHTIHLFVRMAPTPDPEGLSAEATSNANGSGSGNRGEDGSGIAVVTINETVSSAVFPSDSARRVDPLMLDSPLGNCARRVKLWSSFLLIIYTMKVMGQFALLANDQQQGRSQEEAGENGTTSGTEEDRPMMNRYDDYPQYYTPDPLVGGLELLVHAFGVYVGCVGFKAAHDTDIRPIRFYCRGVVWLALLTMVEQIYTTVKISQADFPTSERTMQYPYGASQPTKEDIVSANIFQAIMLAIMWLIAIRHSYLHQREVAIYNQSFAAAAMNAAPPVALPADVV